MLALPDVRRLAPACVLVLLGGCAGASGRPPADKVTKEPVSKRERRTDEPGDLKRELERRLERLPERQREAIVGRIRSVPEDERPAAIKRAIAHLDEMARDQGPAGPEPRAELRELHEAVRALHQEVGRLREEVERLRGPRDVRRPFAEGPPRERRGPPGPMEFDEERRGPDRWAPPGRPEGDRRSLRPPPGADRGPERMERRDRRAGPERPPDGRERGKGMEQEERRPRGRGRDQDEPRRPEQRRGPAPRERDTEEDDKDNEGRR